MIKTYVKTNNSLKYQALLYTFVEDNIEHWKINFSHIKKKGAINQPDESLRLCSCFCNLSTIREDTDVKSKLLMTL